MHETLYIPVAQAVVEFPPTPLLVRQTSLPRPPGNSTTNTSFVETPDLQEIETPDLQQTRDSDVERRLQESHFYLKNIEYKNKYKFVDDQNLYPCPRINMTQILFLY